jgi:hypothetical protein
MVLCLVKHRDNFTVTVYTLSSPAVIEVSYCNRIVWDGHLLNQPLCLCRHEYSSYDRVEPFVVLLDDRFGGVADPSFRNRCVTW